MHREPAVFYSRAHRTIDGDASTQTWGMQGDQVLVRMPENMQKETWTAQESAKLKKTEIQALVLRDPYFSEQERTNTSRWFMNDKNNHLYNLWKVEGEAPFAESDVWYDPERDQIQDLFALHNQTMSGGDNTHSITEEMMPYLRVVVRPTQLGNYKPVTPEEAALFAERGLIAKMFPYSVCIYLRTAKTNAALRKREFGVTRRIREILQMFGPTSSPMWDSTNLHDKHYARRLQAVFRNQIVMPTSEGQEMEDEHRAAEAAAAAVAAADGEDGNQGAAASSSSANSGAASGTFSLITTTRPASAGDNEHAGEEYDDFLELAVPEVHEVTAETSLVQTPAGLKLPLYDYQRRILSWLTELEMNKESREIVMPLGDGKPPYIRLGKGGMLYHVKRHEFAATDIWTPRMPPVQRLSCRGAIEASRVGSGKTISALALLQANPFRSVQDLGIARRDIGKYIPSRATLIVCRSDLTAQWQAEAVKALPGTAKVLLLTTIHDYRALTWNQVLLADAVIVSTAFLNNTNYRARVAELAGSSKFENPLPRDDDDQDEIVVSDMQQALDDYIGDLLHRGRKWFGTRKGGVVLDRIFFHRVVVDELHEFVPTEMDGLNQSERYHRRRRMHWGENRQEEVKLAPAVRKLAAETRAFLFAIRTRFLLGLTGSPVLDSPAAAERLLRLLQVRGLPANDNSQAAFMAVQSFLNKYTRRANPDLKLPPVHYQTVWMHLTPQELGLAAAAVGRDAATRLMALQHHQLLDELAGLAGNARGHEHDEVLTAAEMTRRLQADRTGKMDRLAKRITELERSLDRARADVVNKLTQFPAARRWSIQLGLTMDDLQAADGGFSQSQSQAVGATRHNAALLAIPDGDRQAIRAAVNLVIQLKRTIDTTTVELNDVTRAFNFMAAVLETVENSVEQECPICMEVIEANGELSMTACGHCYCVACSVQMRQAWNSRCAICRQPVGVMTRMKLAPSEPETVGKGHADGDDGMDVDTGDNLIDYAKYGSKVKSMVQTALRTVQRDPTAKIIMFVQFRRLASIISKAFTELGVPNASLSGGNVLTKRKAVTSFKKDPNIKVLFLSYQDSVSGLHLVEANHVFICHPFLAEDEATSRAYETQGIARAVRGMSTSFLFAVAADLLTTIITAGQLREVTIVRFASRGTIEEELTNQRTMREEERPEVVVEEP
ncbi:hypothetical protein BC828DRAFT_375762 [Blastocladiella britannica]|nr:hypothetical protein BC828DRAFT_375762 [Blastocladiella britannica]